MTVTTNTENLRQFSIRFSLIVEQILAFALSPNVVREVRNVPQNLNKLLDDVLEYFRLGS